MAVVRDEQVSVRSEDEVVRVRQLAREWSVSLGFGLVDQTKIVTAASELARNAILHGGGGEATVEVVHNGTRRGVRLLVADRGPGIADIDLAMRDGFSTSGGLGLGLSGAKRLANEFTIESRPGEGTTVSITRWK
jgi:serine/threonine-protein kinase RsbT